VKFVCGDSTDQALCIGLNHEFLRCDDAFNDFVKSATATLKQPNDRRLSCRAYNDYARFLHHLYEFMIGAESRERGDTDKAKTEWKDAYIARHAQRVLGIRREAILNGTAPAWENHISAFPVTIPDNFAVEFRQIRNAVFGHVLAKRASLNLSDFYERNHKFVYMLYHESRNWWSLRDHSFPALGQITAFSVAIREDPPEQ
jgi:hypothetical protein